MKSNTIKTTTWPCGEAKEIKEWPAVMPELEPRHFAHGSYRGRGVYQENLAGGLVCGTPRCAVGNVMVAFGQDPRQESWDCSLLHEQVDRGDGPMGKFVAAYIRELGGYGQTICDLSELFENDIVRISVEVAADAFNKTVRSFGYIEDCRFSQKVVIT